MTQYFRKVICTQKSPNSDEVIAIPKECLEPVGEPLYTKADMLSCWNAALSHALKLKGYYKTFAGFIKSLKK